MDSAGYREKALREHGEVCFECGSDRNVVVHHKDGNRENDDLINLVPLCASCHAKVHAGSDEHPTLVRELGHRPKPIGETTTIEVREDQAELLHDMKERGDSFKDVIDVLLFQMEMEES